METINLQKPSNEELLLVQKLAMFKVLLESPLTLNDEMAEIIKDKIATYEKRLEKFILVMDQ